MGGEASGTAGTRGEEAERAPVAGLFSSDEATGHQSGMVGPWSPTHRADAENVSRSSAAPGYAFFSRFDVCWKMHLGEVKVIQTMSSNARHSISWTFFSPLSLPRRPVAPWMSADAIWMASGVPRR
jgi:hypothetical protein